MRTLYALLLILTLLCALPAADTFAVNPTLTCTMQSSSSSTGNGTACPVGGYNILTMQVSGTPGTIVFEGSVDGTNYVRLLCMNTPGLVYVGTATATGVFHCSVKNFAFARARIDTAGTSVSVSGVASTLTWGTAAF